MDFTLVQSSIWPGMNTRQRFAVGSCISVSIQVGEAAFKAKPSFEILQKFLKLIWLGFGRGWGVK